MSRCFACSAYLSRPFIKCAQCTLNIELCLQCFAGGYEKFEHRSDHCYEVIKDDFSLFESRWSVADEFHLLEAIADCGYSNWNDISEEMKNKTSEQCERHYEQYYLNKPHQSLPEMRPADMHYFPCPLPCRPSLNPPRPSDDSIEQVEMSGYCAARSDFNIEHNNFAELDIKDVSVNDIESDLEADLQLAMLRVYRNILKERQRRKFVVRQFGLIDTTRHIAECHRYERILGVKSMESLRRLSQLFTLRPLHWDLCTEALTYETALRQRIVELQKYRMAGLRSLGSGKVYDKLISLQETSERHLLSDVLRFMKDSFQCQPYAHRKLVFDKLSKGIDIGRPGTPRRSAPPLDVTSLPGSDRLTSSERQLCSRVRLVPDSYLDFKRLLVNENNKFGCLRLAQARTLIKIDVNKTRKIFDFLVSEGIIASDRTVS